MKSQSFGNFKLESDDFLQNGELSLQFTCDGVNISPELHWDNAPAETKSFALIVEDPDAPSKDPFVHWILFDILPTQKKLEQNVVNKGLEAPIKQGLNDYDVQQYKGSCPPQGENHRYFFKLYALDVDKLPAEAVIGKYEFWEIIKEHALAHAELVGTYKRKI